MFDIDNIAKLFEKVNLINEPEWHTKAIIIAGFIGLIYLGLWCVSEMWFKK